MVPRLEFGERPDHRTMTVVLESLLIISSEGEVVTRDRKSGVVEQSIDKLSFPVVDCNARPLDEV